MFDAILNDRELFSIRRETCEENNICIEFSGDLREEDYIILKIDAHYHSKNKHNPEPSIDCLIIVRCTKSDGFDFYLVELKNIKSTKGIIVNNIAEKFKTTVEVFLKKEFAHIFLANYRLNNLKFYLVSDALQLKKLNIDNETYRKKIKGTRLDTLQSIKPLEFRGKIASISPELPNPLINTC